ncbi:hypothetical protein GN156_05615 [bacterium LRH843]|nr:hypothetical protein [bacterium LRH843]
MNVPSIRIQSTDAQIGLRMNRPDMRIKQQNADLQIRQQHVGLIEISKTASKLHIDQTEAFADANLKSPLRMANEFWQKTTNEVMQYIAKTAQDGNQMLKIENGSGAIQRIAKANSERPPLQATFGYMPRSMSQVKFNYEPSKITMKAPYKEPDITVNLRPPQIEIPKWQTEAYMRQKNGISFEAVGGKVNLGL